MAKKLLEIYKAQQQPFRIDCKKSDEADIILYGSIGQSFWDDSGISAKKFSDELKALPDTVKNINVRVNSPGGDVFDGVAIYNRLKQHKAKKTVYIDGLAASIASIISLAGDEIIMGDGALFMIHLPWTWAAGNRMDLENTTARLIDVEEQLLSIYAKKTKIDRNELRKMLEAETWMDADEAIEKGFVDQKAEEALPIAASVFDKAKWINRVPKNFKSESMVVDANKAELKNKIGAFLKARK